MKFQPKTSNSRVHTLNHCIMLFLGPETLKSKSGFPCYSVASGDGRFTQLQGPGFLISNREARCLLTMNSHTRLPHELKINFCWVKALKFWLWLLEHLVFPLTDTHDTQTHHNWSWSRVRDLDSSPSTGSGLMCNLREALSSRLHLKG